MTTVNIHEAKTQLSRLLVRVEQGETVTIAKAGKPIARLTSIHAPQEQRRLGFLAGQAQIPEDFDTMGANQIANEFEGLV